MCESVIKGNGGEDVDTFQKLLEPERKTVEYFVRCRIPVKVDAEDVLQEIFLTAYQKLEQLKKPESFKAWILSIARNKCNDYFRKKAVQLEIPVDVMPEVVYIEGRYGISVTTAVQETLMDLADKDKQILYMFYWKEMPQNEIAKLLKIPVGTVKSRIHAAKQNFKKHYPYHTENDGGKRK